MHPSIALTVVALAVLLIAERAGKKRVSAAAKVVASLGFLLLAAHHELHTFLVGQALYAGLILSFVGDVLLISKNKRAFLIGLGAFLLAHVSYAASFLSSENDPRLSSFAAVPVVLLVILILRWLWPHVSSSMKLPVAAYAIAIGTMVALAAGVSGPQAAMILNGAIVFLLSDLFVARERFVSQGFINRSVGLPLYYGGQILLIVGTARGHAPVDFA